MNDTSLAIRESEETELFRRRHKLRTVTSIAGGVGALSIGLVMCVFGAGTANLAGWVSVVSIGLLGGMATGEVMALMMGRRTR